MKSIVVELYKNIAILLSEEGCIVKVKNKNYELGQEVNYSMSNNFKIKKIPAIAATAACFLLVIGGGVAAYYTPDTYVSLDVNPSIKFEVNMFDRVILAEGVNDDGSSIIDDINLDNLENTSIDDAVALTVDEISDAGYFEGNEGGIVITTSSDDMEDADKLAQELETVANETVEENDFEATVVAEAVGKARVAEARELGVTPGKLNLVEKLIKSSNDPESVDLNVWLNKSVKDIMAQTKENKKQVKEQIKETDNNTQGDTQEDIQSDTQVDDTLGEDVQTTENTQGDIQNNVDAKDSNSTNKKDKSKNRSTTSDESMISTDNDIDVNDDVVTNEDINNSDNPTIEEDIATNENISTNDNVIDSNEDAKKNNVKNDVVNKDTGKEKSNSKGKK